MNKKENSYITISDLWEIFTHNIRFFSISIIACVSLATIYLIVTPPTYKRTASVLIKDEQQGQSIAYAAIESLGLVNTQGNLYNEVNLFKTPILLEAVVSRLQLHHSCKGRSRTFRWVDLYNKAPFKVEADSLLDNFSFKFRLKKEGEDSFILTKLSIGKEDINETIDGVYDTPIATPYGSFIVRKCEVKRSIAEMLSQEKEEEKKEPYTLYYYSKGKIPTTARSYASALTVALREEFASIIDLSIASGSTKKAEDILNTIIAVYNENWIEDKNLIAMNTNKFINERLAIIEQELGEVDKDISTFKSENLLPDLSAVAGMNLQTSNEILKQQIELNNQLSMATYILQYMTEDNTNDKLLPSNSGINSPSITGLITTYNERMLEKNTLLANSSESNPIVASLVADIKSLKQVLILSVNDLVNTLNIQIENARNEELMAQKKLSNSPSQELFLLSSGREHMIKEQLYLFLLQKREENELSQAFSAYNTKILGSAAGEDMPIAPQKTIILFIGFFMGCILPTIALILKANLQTTVQNKEDLASITMPYLGSIPNIKPNNGLPTFGKRKSTEKEAPQIVTQSGGRDSASELFRVLRTNLDFILGQEKKCKTVMLTSFNPMSGKSFVTTNLAVSMATKDSRVLLIDGDFRRGTSSRVVNSPNTGLVNYLNSPQIDIETVICKGVSHPKLDVLPMGITPPNPTELLLTDRFSSVLEELQQKYDYIFIDCPPVEIVTDAQIIGKHCDSTLFVVRVGLMDKRQLPALNELYTSKKFPNMGLILNAVEINNRYGYGSDNSNYDTNNRGINV